MRKLMGNERGKTGLLLMALGLIMGQACPPNEPLQTEPSKTVHKYTLTKLDKTKTHKLSSAKIKGLASSNDGEFVYVIGTDNATLKALDVGKDTWHDALDWTKAKKANDHAVIDLSGHKIDHFSGNLNGLLFTLSGNGGLVVLKGIGEANTSHYPQGAGKFKNGKFMPHLITKNDNSLYLYLFNSAVAAKGVIFHKYVEPPTNDTVGNWDNTLKKNGGALAHAFLTETQDHGKNLLLADKDGIKRLKEADIGTTAKALDNTGNTIYPIKDFELDGVTANKEITSMDLAEDKYLLVGLKSTSLNSGGLAFADITAPTPKWETFGKGLGLTIHKIVARRGTHKTGIEAIIMSDKGFLLFL